MKINFGRLVLSLVMPLAAGGIGSMVTIGAIENWYKDLKKPSLIPPNEIFGPVWTVLYILIGIALYIVWNRSEGEERKLAFRVFAVQLLLNMLWSVLFFGLQSPALASLEIIVLWLAILANIHVFGRISRWAGVLLIPYLLWTSFAAYLTFCVWLLN